MFGSHATLNQYLKHLRWAHRFLHYQNMWETPAVKQAVSGIRKSGIGPRRKLALLSRQVARIVKTAMGHGDEQVAALAAISRLFLMRVPSEVIPLQWDGEHSKIQLVGNSALITLMRRKNLSTPSVLERRDIYQACNSNSIGLVTSWFDNATCAHGHGHLPMCTL